jgi:DNA-binding NtrC family response regulator
MPGKNGWETFQQMSCETPLVPVIIITARCNQLFPALAAGAGALMEKPLDFPKLLQTIRDLIAEPEAARWARNAGKSAQFHYLPASAA